MKPWQSQLIELLKRVIFPHRKFKRDANKHVVEFYKAHKHENINYLQNYWSKNKYWDFFYHSLPHVTPSNKFIPRDYYALKVEQALDNFKFSDFALEKNYYDKLFSGMDVKIPKTYYRFIDGTLLDSGFRRVEIVEIHRIFNSQFVIVKNTLSSSGHGVRKFKLMDGVYINSDDKFNFDELVRLFGNNFICQEVIVQNKNLAGFHPQSLNTFRVLTYRSVINNKVHVTLATFKMGVKNSTLDNVSAGGIAVGIDISSGKLMKYALDNDGVTYTEHPDTGIKFEGFSIPYFTTIEAKVKQLADVLAHNRLIGWDVTVDDEGVVILIEPNIGVGAWAMQITTGSPLLGEFSDEVKQYIKTKNKYK